MSDLDVLIRLGAAAHAAYREANQSLHRSDIVGMGADGSPTEEIDRVVEAELLAVLAREGIDWDVLSEEAGLLARGGSKTLVVDPIDGSHNALRRLPAATVSLALGQGTLGGIEVGLVHDLTTGTTYWAERGRGAYRDGRRIRTRPWDPATELLFVNLGRHATDRALAWARDARRLRSLGCASLEMSMVAQGSGDGYLFENDRPERNLRVTDIAAAYRILTEAGGGVVGDDLASLEPFPLRLDQHTSVLAYGDARLLEHLRRPPAPPAVTPGGGGDDRDAADRARRPGTTRPEGGPGRSRPARSPTGRSPDGTEEPV
ncbi:MAG: inositol monophosphatase family protein [Thermoplasmata archaeon]